MPKVMIRRDGGGELSFYIAKRDLEEKIVEMEHSGPARWGGELTLSDGSRFAIDTFEEQPALPLTLRAKRLD